MPNRVVRGGLWNSDHFLGLRDNGARVCYLRLYAEADDFGNLEGSPGQLLRMWREFGIDSPEKVAKTLHELVDATLIGAYEVGGKAYLHIFKFWQRLRQKTRSIPPSPWLEDELNQEDGENPSDICQTRVGHASADGGSRVRARALPETKRNERKGNERNRKETLPPPQGANGVEHANAAPADAGLAVAVAVTVGIPLKDGGEYVLSPEQLTEFERLYPAVDVPQTLAEIRAWNLANPGRRKSREDVLRHVNTWFAKEQNRG
jgi:hypothetical protein